MFTRYFVIPAILSIACLLSEGSAVLAQHRGGRGGGHVSAAPRGRVSAAPRGRVSAAPRGRVSVAPRSRVSIAPRTRAFVAPRANINSGIFNRNRLFRPGYAGFGSGYYGSGYYGAGYYSPYGYGNYGYGYNSPYGYGNYGYGYNSPYGYGDYGYGNNSPYGYDPYAYSPDYSNPPNAPNSGVQTDTATVRVLLPNSQALVWVDGKLTTQTGTDRLFNTPLLPVGSSYTYRVQASWMTANGAVSQERVVNVTPGTTTVVDFTQPNPVSSQRY